MCLTRIKHWFKRRARKAPGRNESPRPTVLPEDRSAIPLIIPHPEEPPDYRQTVDNVDIEGAVERWMGDYGVPQQYRDFWLSRITIELDPGLPYPAAAADYFGGRRITIRPEYVNSGVIAHEQAHNSYALLKGREKGEFSRDYNALKGTDPLIVKLYQANPYGLTNDVEGHAELYRYLNESMPRALKRYYPRLIDSF